MNELSTYGAEAPRFSRAWWLQKARSLFWIVLVTVLIWVYADMEFTDNIELSAKLVISTSPTDRLQLLSEPMADVNFVVRGNRSSVDRYRRLLSERGGVISFRVPEGYGPERHALRVVDDILAPSAELRREGLTPLSATPATIEIRLDRIHTETLKVQFDHTGVTFASGPVVRPDRVAIRVPESRWERLDPSAARVLKTVTVDLKNEPTDTVIRKPVELVRMVGGVKVEPERDTVEVTFTIAQRTEPRAFPVTVQILTPATWAHDGTWRDYELKRQDELAWRKQITVSGPKQDLDKLRPQDIQAYVVLSEDDRRPVDSWLERPVIVRLPKNLSVTVVGAEPTVKFKLVKRPAASGS